MKSAPWREYLVVVVTSIYRSSTGWLGIVVVVLLEQENGNTHDRFIVLVVVQWLMLSFL